MSVAELHSPTKQETETRKILGPGGNRVRVFEAEKKKNDGLMTKKKAGKNSAVNATKNLVSESPKPVAAKNGSVIGCSDSPSCNELAVKSVSLKRRAKSSSLKAAKVVPDGVQTQALSSVVRGPVKRCHWITPNSESLYVSFHDDEWGNPVTDERELFELLVLSQALAELTWPTILSKRDTFRRLFDNFEPSSVASIDEKMLQSLSANGSSKLSEQKLRAIVENAKQVLKIQQEFGSFSNYCWRFVNNRPVTNGFRYARQVPAKTPKSELISKDLMKRGFRCVGPTVVYSFMQVAGMVNDHLVSCFRYNECNNSFRKKLDAKVEKTDITVDTSETACT